jgi:serine/threonine protein kinase
VVFAAGTRLGPYEILAPLGEGGMGEVYRAKDTRLGRTVAIKVLPAELARHSGARERLEREAQAISALTHPNICTLFDVGEDIPSGPLPLVPCPYPPSTTW